ncbi:MAG: hypothetical protein CL917_08540 [Deltaproteobacteria bacterium]|nr:hypothetical protein [Deltaproteobacteria bacterium]
MTVKIQLTDSNLANKNKSVCTDTSCCPPKTPVVRVAPKISRNDPCHCGSGRKHKKCCA